MQWKKKGYLIPSVVEPDSYVCLKVYLPDNEGYIEAFSGQFHDLGIWMTWEDESTKSASSVASVMKDAIDYTYANGWLNSCKDCELDDMTKDELLELIREAMDMNINVNCGGGCGCGCGCGNQGNLPPDGYQTPPPITGNVNTPSDSDGRLWKCNMSHYLIYSLRLTMIQAVNWTGSYELWLANWRLIFQFPDDPVDSYMFGYKTYTAVLALINGVSTSQLVTEVIDPNYNELVCAIYSSYTSQQASDNLMELLRQIFPNYVMQQLATEIASELPYDTVFTPQPLSNLPPSYTNRTCGCSTIDDEITEPDGYLLVAPVESEMSFVLEGGTNTHTYDGSLFTYSATAGEWNANRADLDESALLARVGGSAVFGMLIEIVSENADDGSDNLNGFPNNVVGYDYNMQGTTGTYLCRYKGDLYASDANYASFVDQFANKSSYGNVAISGSPNWKMGSHFVPKTYTYRVWAIVQP